MMRKTGTCALRARKAGPWKNEAGLPRKSVTNTMSGSD